MLKKVLTEEFIENYLSHIDNRLVREGSTLFVYFGSVPKSVLDSMTLVEALTMKKLIL